MSMPKGRKISLVVTDVDGTLVTEEKVPTPRARNAVKALRDHAIRFAITSGRPSRGMAMLLDALEIDTAIADFNGGLFVRPDLTFLPEKAVPVEIANRAIDLIRRQGLDVWVYSGNDWLISKPNAPQVARVAFTAKFEPKLLAGVAEHLEKVAKIVGVSDELERVRGCEADARTSFGDRVTAARSQPYYLDITNKHANKGQVVEFLSAHIGVPTEEIATIGDQQNDVLMFAKSDFSMAMGNASDEVKAEASAVTDSYRDEGVTNCILNSVVSGAQ